MISLLRSRLKNLLHAQEGNVIILVALASLMLVIAAGTAIDMARAQILQMKISSALDAANLAAGVAAINVPPGDNQATWVQQQAQRYFNANFPSGYLESNPTINVTSVLSNGGTTVNLTATTQQNTSFMQIVGINTVTVTAASQVTRAAPGMTEVVLALDNTGSMLCDVTGGGACTGGPSSKIEALKSAATLLVNTLASSTGTPATPNLFIGLVPFSEGVNISQATGNPTSWLSGSSVFASNEMDSDISHYSGHGTGWGPTANQTAATQWQGCVAARNYPMDVTDDPPMPSNPNAPNEFPIFYYYPVTPYDSVINNWVTGTLDPDQETMKQPYVYASPATTAFTVTDGTTPAVPSPPFPLVGAYSTTTMGPNLFCPQPMIPMTPNLTAATSSPILSGINSMVATGDTNIDIGAAWGWRMLSPNWTGAWGGDMATNNLPLPYFTPGSPVNSQKILILMSDGWNHMEPTNYTSYGYGGWDAESQTLLGSEDEGQQEALLDLRTKWVCDSLRFHGVIVYTIAFGVDDGNPNDPSSANYALLKYCATDPGHFFGAASNTDLQRAFASVASSIANLRVSQ